ncbi:uncharacterized protein [Apostichopus japonicus]|uniref:uncharacterized protein isoform X3 n=1 Tax=Stichopus japonicus TaxID=307972 RepID=UPI003AB8217D
MADLTEEHREEVDATEETDGKVTSSQSEALKAIVDFDDEAPDVNTELFRSTIRTTPLDSEKEQVGVDELLHPDGLTSSEKDAKSEEAAAGKTIEKDALKAAADSEDEEEELLEGYLGEEVKKEGEDWTIVRCSSVDNLLEDGETDGKEKMEVDRGSVDDEVREENDKDKSFEIIDEREVEEIKEDQEEEGKQGEDATERVPEDLEMDKDEYVSEDKDSDSRYSTRIFKVSSGDEEKVQLGGLGLAKEEEEDEKMDITDGVDDDDDDDPLGVNRRPASPKDGVNSDTAMDEGKKDKQNNNEESKEEEEEVTEESNKTDKDEKDDAAPSSSSSVKADNRKSLPEFDELASQLDVGSKLDSNAQKSRARLAKTGVLAQRRKPPRSSWYFEEGKNPQEFMFTDTTEVKPLKQLKENDEQAPTPSTRTPPKPSRRPPGAMASPLLLPGLGQIGKVKLKKTTPTESVRSTPATKSPPFAATKPLRSVQGQRVLPIPVKRQPAHSKGKAPMPPEGKSSSSSSSSSIPIFSSKSSSKSPTEEVASPRDAVVSSSSNKQPLRSPKETVVSPRETPSVRSPKGPLASPKETPSVTSPKEPVLSPKETAFRLPSTTAAKPSPKPRPKPLPKPRPQSLFGVPSSTDPAVAKDTKMSGSSKDDLNSDILKNKSDDASAKDHKGPTSPRWLSDKNKKLPPIKSPVTKTSDEAKPNQLPEWKQKLLKKKKDQEALGIKKSNIPPPLSKKDGEPNKAPFTTVPQWQLDLAEKNRKKKEDTREDGVSRPAKDRKKEDSNKIENKKPPLTPKPAIATKKKFDAIPPAEKDSVPSWQKSAHERRKKNEKNLLIENGEKKDSEKPAEITASTKKGLPLINSNIPQWKLELERKNTRLFQRLNHAD